VIGRLSTLFVRMLRVKVAVTMWTFMLLGVARHAGATLSVDLVFATVALAASYVTATTLNDIADVDIDRVNRPGDRGRPLVLGEATPAELWRTHAAATGLAMGAALPLGPQGVAVVGASLLVSYAYSAGPIRLSRRMVLAPLGLALAYVVIPYALGVVITGSSWDRRDVPLVAGLFVLFVARIVLKDFRDRLGDAAFGKPTMLLRMGKPVTCAISVAGAALGTIILIAGLGVPLAVAAILALYGLGIEWMLLRLAHTHDARLEQVAIGTAARAGNGLLISMLAWMLLRADGADERTATMFLLALAAVFATSFLDAALHPERVRIGYKAPSEPQIS
jgi:4-hydroxybenzoate polyprenyltransferase